MNAINGAQRALELRGFLAKSAAAHDPEFVKRIVSGIQGGHVGTSRLASALNDSKVLIWEHDIFQLAVNGSSEFDGTTLTETIASIVEPEFWLFYGFGQQHKSPDLPPTVRCVAVLLVPEDFGFAGVWFYTDAFHVQEPQHLIPYSVGFGLPINSRIPEHLSRLIACHEFLKLKLAALEPVRLPRGERRRLAKVKQEIPEIRIVQLRQRERSQWHDATGREYHHRWIVRGHWRRLTEPRKKDGAQVTFVESYVKGPKDAPLLKPRETVYAVAR